MSSKRNTSALEPNFINYPKGLPLNRKAFKRFVRLLIISETAIANELGLSRSELRKRLYLRKRFDCDMLHKLVEIFGARRALEIIWFPTLQEKKEVKRYVFNTSDKVEGIEEGFESAKNALKEEIVLTDEERQQFKILTQGFDRLFVKEFFRRKTHDHITQQK